MTHILNLGGGAPQPLPRRGCGLRRAKVTGAIWPSSAVYTSGFTQGQGLCRVCWKLAAAHAGGLGAGEWGVRESKDWDRIPVPTAGQAALEDALAGGRSLGDG